MNENPRTCTHPQKTSRPRCIFRPNPVTDSGGEAVCWRRFANYGGAAGPKKKASSADLAERLLRKCVLPHLAGRKVHHALRDTPVQANRSLLVLSKVLNLAESWGLRPQGSNPCQGIERYREKRRQRFLSGAELARLGEALAEAEREDSAHPSGILAFRLLLLTGARSGEIPSLRWSEVDFKRRSLQLQDSKPGEKTIPLGAPALELLANAPRMEGNPYLCFGDRAAKALVGLTKIWYRIRKSADLEEVCWHRSETDPGARPEIDFVEVETGAFGPHPTKRPGRVVVHPTGPSRPKEHAPWPATPSLPPSTVTPDSARPSSSSSGLKNGRPSGA